MVYKIEKAEDLNAIQSIDDSTRAIISYYVEALVDAYGDKESTDTGGYILYVAPHTDCNRIKDYFDYSQRTVEYVEQKGEVCSALYLLNNDFAVIIVVSINDAPTEISNEINDN